MSLRQNLDADHNGEAGSPAPQGRVRLQDILVALGVSVVILIIGYNLGQFTFNEIQGRGTAYFVLAAALGVMLTALAYYKIEMVMLGFMAVIWVAIGTSPDIATGASTGTGKAVGLSQIGVAFLLFVWLLRVLVRRHLSFARLPINGFLIAYLLFNVWSAVNGMLFWDSTVAHFWGPPNGGRTPLPVIVFDVGAKFLAVASFWLFANNLRDAAWVRRASWLLLLPGAIIFAIRFIPNRLPLNAYSVLLEIVLTCTLFAWLIEPRAPGAPARRGLRFWGWLLLACLLYQVFRMNITWVSGWFGLFVGLYTVAFLRSKKLFLALALAGLMLYVVGHAFIQANVVHKVQTSGDTYRFAMARGAYLFAMKFPLGVGPGNYRSYVIYYGSPAVWDTATFSSAHSFYSQALAEAGFGGLFLVVLWVVGGLVMLARFYRAMPSGPSRTFVLGLAGMWAGVCGSSGIGDYLVPVYYNGAVSTMATTIYVWFGLGIAVAHARLAGLVTEEKGQPAVPSAAPAAVPDAATFYPRRMGGESASPLPRSDSYYPRRMGRPRE